jgi:nucleotide-binding universal stress UspA family protein
MPSPLSPESRARMEKAWERWWQEDRPWGGDELALAPSGQFEAGWVARGVEAEERQRELETALMDAHAVVKKALRKLNQEDEEIRAGVPPRAELRTLAKRLDAALAVSSTENEEEQK